MKCALRTVLLVVMFGYWLSAAGFTDVSSNSSSDAELARKFTPVLYFHPAELFRPQAVDGFVSIARLREERRLWFDVNLTSNVSISDLLHYRKDTFFLDSWFGSEGISDSKNYDSHRSLYQDRLSPEAGGSPIIAYVHINRKENPEYITIQYWLFYYYNDWFNKHEGDWEMVEVILSNTEEPLWVVLSQHHGGTRRSWSTTIIEESTHPVVYVALGSHANYFWGNETYPNGMDIGNTRVEIMDRTGSAGRIIPAVELIPVPAVVDRRTTEWRGAEWILFGGHWGETAQLGDFGGPQGPAYKGDQWEKPFSWGLDQPLDIDTWYTHRLRVQLTGSQITSVESSHGETLSRIELNDSTLLLHADLLPEEVITIEIHNDTAKTFSASITVPDVSAAKVARYQYDFSSLNSILPASIVLAEGKEPRFTHTDVPMTVTPITMQLETFKWENPDLIWFPGLLSVNDLLKGLLFCLLAGWIPALIYVGILYWADRYEKEPVGLLATAFFWGALPALFIALILRIFIDLPLELLGARAMETLQIGLITPLVEETLKGAIIVFLALRYRREFDDVLDGIIYGGLVGLGFAMNANIISYLGSFLTRGFSGLGNIMLSEGVIFGLNHAFYSAILGAGLGFARTAIKRWQRWVFPLVAYLLSIIIHSLHNLLLHSSMGLSPFSVILSLVGVLVIAVAVALAIRNQHHCLKAELKEELPDELYQTLIAPYRRFSAEWDALFSGGVRAWQRTRRLHQVCAEFAFKRMQARLFPGEEKIKAEMLALREQIKRLSAGSAAGA